METNESILDAIVHLGREFSKVLEMMDRKLKPNVKDMSSDNFMNIGFSCKNKTVERPKKGKGGMLPTCYDQDSKRKCEDGTTKQVMAFTGKYDYNNESSYEDMYDGEIA